MFKIDAHPKSFDDAQHIRPRGVLRHCTDQTRSSASPTVNVRFVITKSPYVSTPHALSPGQTSKLIPGSLAHNGSPCFVSRAQMTGKLSHCPSSGRFVTLAQYVRKGLELAWRLNTGSANVLSAWKIATDGSLESIFPFLGRPLGVPAYNAFAASEELALLSFYPCFWRSVSPRALQMLASGNYWPSDRNEICIYRWGVQRFQAIAHSAILVFPERPRN